MSTYRIEIAEKYTLDRNTCYYRVTDTRGAQTVVDLFKDRDKDSNLKALLADGYTGYDSGLKTLKDEFGIDLERASCWCHIRRPIHRLLKAGGLLRIYNKYLLPAGSSFPPPRPEASCR